MMFLQLMISSIYALNMAFSDISKRRQLKIKDQSRNAQCPGFRCPSMNPKLLPPNFKHRSVQAFNARGNRPTSPINNRIPSFNPLKANIPQFKIKNQKSPISLMVQEPYFKRCHNPLQNISSSHCEYAYRNRNIPNKRIVNSQVIDKRGDNLNHNPGINIMRKPNLQSKMKPDNLKTQMIIRNITSTVIKPILVPIYQNSIKTETSKPLTSIVTQRITVPFVQYSTVTVKDQSQNDSKLMFNRILYNTPQPAFNFIPSQTVPAKISKRILPINLIKTQAMPTRTSECLAKNLASFNDITANPVPVIGNDEKIQVLTVTKYVKEKNKKASTKDLGLSLEGPRIQNIVEKPYTRKVIAISKKNNKTFDNKNLKDLIEEISSMEQDAVESFNPKLQLLKTSAKKPNLDNSLELFDDKIDNKAFFPGASLKRYYKNEYYRQTNTPKTKKKDTITKTVTQYSKTVTFMKEKPSKKESEGSSQQEASKKTAKNSKNMALQKVKIKAKLNKGKTGRSARKHGDSESYENDKNQQPKVETFSDVNNQAKRLKPSRTITVFNHFNSDVITVDLRKNKEISKNTTEKIRDENPKSTKRLTYVPSKLILRDQADSPQSEKKIPIDAKTSASSQEKSGDTLKDSVLEKSSTSGMRTSQTSSESKTSLSEEHLKTVSEATSKKDLKTSTHTESIEQKSKSSDSTTKEQLYKTITETVTHNFTIREPAVVTNSSKSFSSEAQKSEKTKNTLTITNTSTVTIVKSKASSVVKPETSYKNSSVDSSDHLNHRLDELEKSLQNKKDDYIRVMSKVVAILEKEKAETLNNAAVSESIPYPSQSPIKVLLDRSPASPYGNFGSQEKNDAGAETREKDFVYTKPDKDGRFKPFNKRRMPDSVYEDEIVQIIPINSAYSSNGPGSKSFYSESFNKEREILKNPGKIILPSTTFDSKSKSISVVPEKPFTKDARAVDPDMLDRAILEKLKSILLPLTKTSHSSSTEATKNLDGSSIHKNDKDLFSTIMDTLRKYNMTIGPSVHKSSSAGQSKSFSSVTESTAIPQSTDVFTSQTTDKTHGAADTTSASISSREEKMFSTARPSILVNSRSASVSEPKIADPKNSSMLNKELTGMINSLLFKYGKCISTIVIKTSVFPSTSASTDFALSTVEPRDYSKESSHVKTASTSSIVKKTPEKYLKSKIGKLRDNIKFNITDKSSSISFSIPTPTPKASESLSVSTVTLVTSFASVITRTSEPQSHSVDSVKKTSKHSASSTTSIDLGNKKSPLVEILDFIAEDNLGASFLVDQADSGSKKTQKSDKLSKKANKSVSGESKKEDGKSDSEKLKNEFLLELMKFINSDSRSEEDIQRILRMIKIVKRTKALPVSSATKKNSVESTVHPSSSSKLSVPAKTFSSTKKNLDISKERSRRHDSSSLNSVLSVSTQVITVINGSLPKEKTEQPSKSLGSGSEKKIESEVEKEGPDEKDNESSSETDDNLENKEETVGSPRNTSPKRKTGSMEPGNIKPHKTLRCCYVKSNCKINSVAPSKIKSVEMSLTSTLVSTSIKTESTKPSTLTVTSTFSEYVTTTEVVTKSSTITQQLTVTNEKSITVDRTIPVSTTITETKTFTQLAFSTISVPAATSSSQIPVQPSASLDPITISYTQTIKVPFGGTATTKCPKKEAISPSISTKYIHVSPASKNPSKIDPKNENKAISSNKSINSNVSLQGQQSTGNIGTIDIIDNFKIVESNKKGKVIEVVESNEKPKNTISKGSAKRKRSKRIKSAEITLEDLSGNEPRLIDVEVPFDQLKKLIKASDE